MVSIAVTTDESDDDQSKRSASRRRRRVHKDKKGLKATKRRKRADQNNDQNDDDQSSTSTSSISRQFAARLNVRGVRKRSHNRSPTPEIDQPADLVDEYSDPYAEEQRMRHEDALYQNAEHKYDPPPHAGGGGQHEFHRRSGSASRSPPGPNRPYSPIAPADDAVLEQFVPLSASRFEFCNHKAHVETDPKMAMWCAKCGISATQSELARSSVIQQMDDIHRLNVGKVSPEFWAQMIQVFFYEYVRPMIEDEEDRAKEWYIETIVAHYTRHIISIEVTIRIQQERLDTIATYMADHELLEVSTTTGRVRSKGPGIIKSFIAILTEQRKVAALLEDLQNNDIV